MGLLSPGAPLFGLQMSWGGDAASQCMYKQCRGCVDIDDATVTLQNGLRVKERMTHLQRTSFCGTTEVGKEVDGSSVRVAHA
jgi:hypothetical protein